MDPAQFIIGGSFRSGTVLDTIIDPYTGDPVEKVWRAEERDIRDALLSAEKGAAIVRELPAFRRAGVLHRLADLMTDRKEELVSVLISEAGKVRKLAEAEVMRSIETIRISAEEAVRMNGEVIPLDRTPAGSGRIALSRRVPVGVILAITPFNFPLNLACHKIGPAIASGNAFILKPSSQTPVSALLLGEMILDSGYPKEAVNVFPCDPATIGIMISDPRVRLVSFTGSPEVGWNLAHTTCGRTTLELGGNAAVIVHEDSDHEYAASRIVEGGFSHAGQVCISVQRVFIHRPVYDTVLRRIVEKTGELKIGDPREKETDLGPMISVRAAGITMERILNATMNGARVLTGGDRRGAVVYPTVLTETTSDMDVNRVELFAPVITVTPYDSFGEALHMVNDSPYGLQAGIFTRDINRAFQAYNLIETGAVIINDIPTFRVDLMPYGGVKRSGTGREGPKSAIDEMTEERLMIINTG